MTPLAKRRLTLIGTLAIAGAVLGAVAMSGIGENLVYYWGPAEIAEAGQKAVGAEIRLGGVVEDDVDWNPDTQDLRFSVIDKGVSIVVEAEGAPPDMFRVGIGVVVEGTVNAAGTFIADRVLVKHSNEYKAPEEGVDRETLYRTVEDMTAQ